MSLPKPYYQDESCTIYHADCREILPYLQRVDLVLTDPPYGIGFKYGSSYKDIGGAEYIKLLSSLRGYPLALLQYPEEMMRYCVPVFGAPNDCFIWCYNSPTERQSRIWGFWNTSTCWDNVKQLPKNPLDKRILNSKSIDGVRHYDWCADIQQVKNVDPEKTEHPCQVPSKLIKRIILFTDAHTILDPFMGSGTTLVAAKQLGRKAIGIEIEKKYCDIAIDRLRQEVLPLNQPESRVMEQEPLL